MNFNRNPFMDKDFKRIIKKYSRNNPFKDIIGTYNINKISNKAIKNILHMQQHYKMIGLPNLAYKWLKAVGFSRNFGIIRNLFRNNIKIEKQIAKSYPLYFKYLPRIAEDGWTSLNFKRPSRKLMKKRINMTDQELDKSFMKALLSDSFYIFNRMFNNLAQNLDSGHRKQVEILHDLVNKEKKYYILGFDILFPILEWFRQYAYLKRGGSFKKKSAINKSKEKARNKKIIKKLKDDKKIPLTASKDILLLFKQNEIMVLIRLYRGIPFNKFQYHQMPYGRNSVEHGVYDPDRLTYVDFLKLLVICDNISEESRFNLG